MHTNDDYCASNNSQWRLIGYIYSFWKYETISCLCFSPVIGADVFIAASVHSNHLTSFLLQGIEL